MKKHKRRGIILFYVLIALSVFTYGTVFAKERISDEIKTTCDTDYSTTAEREKCKRDAEICASGLSKSMGKIEPEIVGENGNRYLKFKIGKTNDANVRDAKFSVKIEYNLDGTKSTINLSDVSIGTTKTVTDVNMKGYNNIIIDITATVSTDTKYNDVSCQRKYALEARIRKEYAQSDKISNPSRNSGTGICWKYQNGALTSNDVGNNNNYKKLLSSGKLSYDKLKNMQKGNNTFANLLPYCFSEAYASVENVYSDEQVLKQIYSAASIISASADVNHVELPNSESEGFVKLDPNKKISLTCDAFALASNNQEVRYANVRKFYNEKVAAKKSMVYHSTPNSETEVEVCKVTCVEQVTVSYGPPIAVKAGMCFEYEVEIKSKTICTSDVTANPPKLSDYVVCQPSVNCHNGTETYITQAGPNEDFDNCVNSCDGGKYSQSCINQCYNKVYKKSKRTVKKQSLELSEAAVVRMASLPSWCNGSRSNSQWEEIYNNYKYNGYYGGYYTGTLLNNSWSDIDWVAYKSGANPKTADGNSIKTVPGCYWNDYAGFYFNSRSLAQRTVGEDAKNKWLNGTYDDLNKWSYYPSGTGEASTKNPSGIKWGYNNYASSWCHDWCSYEVGSCNGYLNAVAPAGKSSAYSAYLEDLDNYEKSLSACKAKAACNSTEAKYTMTVNKLNGEIKACNVSGNGLNDDKKCTTWNESNSNKNKVNREDKSHTILKEVDGVCADTSDKSGNDYRALISFPGSYVNNKNGTVKFKVSESEKDFYTYKNGEYCVPLNAKNVNVNWWIWDQVNKRSEETKKDVKTTEKKDTTGVTYNHYDGTYNIGASIKKFGYLEWNVDVSCFYAVSNNSNPGDPGNPDSDKGDGSSTTTDTRFPKNHDIKAAALDDLFPAKDTSDNATGTSNTKEVEKSTKVSKLNYTSKKNSVTKLANSSTRTIGYNWSCDATNLGIKNYWIAPTSLITKIQSQGDNVYIGDEEQDFSIRLTKNNIKNIRNDYKTKKYSNYGTGKYNNDQNDIVFYKSNFLSNTNYVSIDKKPHDKLCNNMKNGVCDSSFIVHSESCPKLNEWLLKD